MQFIDEATIHVKAGAGGNGSAAMRREDNVPRGGPSGGDGGDGGSVIFVADVQLGTLLDFRYHRHYKATPGENGRSKDQYGAAGPDLVLRVPVGTVIHDEATGDLVADLDHDGARAVVAQGGKGGKGNIHFKTPWNQAPRNAEPGTPGEERTLRLELKLLADVGLLGFPNVGKSTFISRVSRARPKVADYPFTTLHPNLGVVRVADEKSFVVADVPGLIEGAAEGAGLGHQFLRHLQRTRLLLHLVDLSPYDDARDPVAEARAIVKELRKYDAELYDKPRWLVLNKLDTLEGAPGGRGTARAKAVAEFRRRFRWHGPTFEISGLTGEGCAALCRAVWEHLDRHREPAPADGSAACGGAALALAAGPGVSPGGAPAGTPTDAPAPVVAPDPLDPRFRPVDPT